MKNSILVSIGVVAALLILQVNPAVGYAVTKNEKKTNATPLFDMQLNRAIKRSGRLNIQTSFVGKGRESAVEFPQLQDLPSWLNMVIEEVREKPGLLDRAVAKIFRNYRLMNAFEKVGIGRMQILSLVNQFKDDPTLLKEGVQKAANVNPDIGLFLKKLEILSEPTANLGECFISALLMTIILPCVIIPLIIMIAILTMLVIPCFLPEVRELYDLLDLMFEMFEGCFGANS